MGHDSAPIDPGPPQEDPSALPTMYLGVVGCLLTVIAILICAWIYYAMESSVEQEVFSRDLVEQREAKAAQLSKLGDIEAAKQAIIQKYGK